jgi:hypothetical protein
MPGVMGGCRMHESSDPGAVSQRRRDLTAAAFKVFPDGFELRMSPHADLVLWQGTEQDSDSDVAQGRAARCPQET